MAYDLVVCAILGAVWHLYQDHPLRKFSVLASRRWNPARDLVGRSSSSFSVQNL